MKKKAAKPKSASYVLRGDQPREHTVALSKAEILCLANSHIKTADKIPAAFGKYLRDNPKLNMRDTSHAKDVFHGLINDHTARAKELRAVLGL